ncbi:MAG: hypothetical protein EOO09_09595 [Chitinophagaceae bacterium]|nr:MAG: hypothetical protein EOO09_09595 [Chitinophagaceae bacterium]
MKKKTTVRLAIVIAVIILLVFGAQTGTTVERTIRVNAGYYEVSVQLNNIRNYRSWYPGFQDGVIRPAADTAKGRSILADGSGRELSLRPVSPSVVAVTEEKGTSTLLQTISAIPLPNEKETEILWAERMPWYKRIANFFTGRDNLKLGLLNLKSTLEDPALRYGFRIELTPVVDSIILTSRRSGADSSRQFTLQVLYDSLASYITRLHPQGVKPWYYVTSNPVSPRKTEFALGVPVDSPGLPAKDVDYLRLPSSGRVLVGKSKIGKLKELYTAMNRYANDQGLQKVAQEMEKYAIEPSQLPQHPDDEVELVFPVY